MSESTTVSSLTEEDFKKDFSKWSVVHKSKDGLYEVFFSETIKIWHDSLPENTPVIIKKLTLHEESLHGMQKTIQELITQFLLNNVGKSHFHKKYPLRLVQTFPLASEDEDGHVVYIVLERPRDKITYDDDEDLRRLFWIVIQGRKRSERVSQLRQPSSHNSVVIAKSPGFARSPSVVNPDAAAIPIEEEVSIPAPPKTDIWRLFFLAIMVIIFVMLAFSLKGNMTGDMAFQNIAIKEILRHTQFQVRPNRYMKFDDISTLQNVFAFMEQVFLPLIYAPRFANKQMQTLMSNQSNGYNFYDGMTDDWLKKLWLNESSLAWVTSTPAQFYSLGGFRTRTVRYKYKKCNLGTVRELYEQCIEDNTVSEADLSWFGNQTLFPEVYDCLASKNDRDASRGITFASKHELEDPVSFRGISGKPFSGGGHYIDFPAVHRSTKFGKISDFDSSAPKIDTKDGTGTTQSYDKAVALYKELKAGGWFSELARGIFIDFNFLNPTTGKLQLHTVCRILFEVHRTGAILPNLYCTTWNFHDYWRVSRKQQMLFILLFICIVVLAVEHFSHLYTYCKGRNHPPWCTCLKKANHLNPWRRHLTTYNYSLSRADRAKDLFVMKVRREIMESSVYQDYFMKWIIAHSKTDEMQEKLQEVRNANEMYSEELGLEIRSIQYAGNLIFFGKEVEDVDCYQQCPLLFNCCRSGTKVRLNLPLYDGAEAKKSLEKFIRQRAAKENPDGIGADFERIHVSGSDDAKGLFRFLCGSGGEAFYRWSFWNKVDLLLIITLTTHICFWLKNVHQFSQMEVGRFYERGEFNSLWEPQSIMQGEETWVFVNAALLPARIIHYFTESSNDARWYREFALSVKGKLGTFCFLFGIFITSFTISGFMLFSANHFMYCTPFYALATTFVGVFKAPDFDLITSFHHNFYMSTIYWVLFEVVMVLIVMNALIGMFVSVAITTEKYMSKQVDKNTVANKISFVFRTGRDVQKAKNFFIRHRAKNSDDRVVEMVFQELIKENQSTVDLHLAQKIDRRITDVLRDGGVNSRHFKRYETKIFERTQSNLFPAVSPLIDRKLSSYSVNPASPVPMPATSPVIIDPDNPMAKEVNDFIEKFVLKYQAQVMGMQVEASPDLVPPQKQDEYVKMDPVDLSKFNSSAVTLPENGSRFGNVQEDIDVFNPDELSLETKSLGYEYTRFGSFLDGDNDFSSKETHSKIKFNPAAVQNYRQQSRASLNVDPLYASNLMPAGTFVGDSGFERGALPPGASFMGRPAGLETAPLPIGASFMGDNGFETGALPGGVSFMAPGGFETSALLPGASFMGGVDDPMSGFETGEVAMGKSFMSSPVPRNSGFSSSPFWAQSPDQLDPEFANPIVSDDEDPFNDGIRPGLLPSATSAQINAPGRGILKNPLERPAFGAIPSATMANLDTSRGRSSLLRRPEFGNVPSATMADLNTSQGRSSLLKRPEFGNIPSATMADVDTASLRSNGLKNPHSERAFQSIRLLDPSLPVVQSTMAVHESLFKPDSLNDKRLPNQDIIKHESNSSFGNVRSDTVLSETRYDNLPTPKRLGSVSEESMKSIREDVYKIIVKGLAGHKECRKRMVKYISESNSHVVDNEIDGYIQEDIRTEFQRNSSRINFKEEWRELYNELTIGINMSSSINSTPAQSPSDLSYLPQADNFGDNTDQEQLNIGDGFSESTNPAITPVNFGDVSSMIGSPSLDHLKSLDIERQRSEESVKI